MYHAGRRSNMAQPLGYGPAVAPEDHWQHRAGNMRCFTCMWFLKKLCSDPGKITLTIGRCRKHAPTICGWPAVFGDDWCGDHKIDEEKI